MAEILQVQPLGTGGNIKSNKKSGSLTCSHALKSKNKAKKIFTTRDSQKNASVILKN